MPSPAVSNLSTLPATPLSSTPTSSGRSSPNPFPRKSQDRTLSDPTSARPSNLSFTALRHDGDEKVIDSEEASEVGDGDGAGSKANSVDLSYLKIPESYVGDGDAEGRDQVGVLYRRQSAPNAPVILRMHSSLGAGPGAAWRPPNISQTPLSSSPPSSLQSARALNPSLRDQVLRLDQKVPSPSQPNLSGSGSISMFSTSASRSREAEDRDEAIKTGIEVRGQTEESLPTSSKEKEKPPSVYYDLAKSAPIVQDVAKSEPSVADFRPSAKRQALPIEPRPHLSVVEQAKRLAAYKAVDNHILPHHRVIGIGSGSTVPYVVERILGRTAEENSKRWFIPTGFQSKELIVKAGLNLGDVDQFPSIDVTIDGADEVDPYLNAIKGGGACHLREKVLAEAADEFIIVADYRKNSEVLGHGWLQGVPIEVPPFAWSKVLSNINRIPGSIEPKLRMGLAKAGPVVTDNGNFVIDAPFDNAHMLEPQVLLSKLKQLTGVVEVGLFCGMAKAAYFGNKDGSVTVKWDDGREERLEADD